MLEFETSELQEVVEESSSLAEVTKEYAIQSNEDYQMAADMLKIAKEKIKMLNDKRKSLTAPLDESKKRIMAFFNPPIEAFTYSVDKLSGLMLSYDREQERKMLQLEQKAREEEEAIKKSLEQAAIKAELEGDTAEAAGIRAQVDQVIVPAVITEELTPKAKGTSVRSRWKAEISDINKLDKQYMLPNMTMLNSIAQATKGTMLIPGVEFVEVKSIVSRG